MFVPYAQCFQERAQARLLNLLFLNEFLNRNCKTGNDQLSDSELCFFTS